MLLHYKKLNMQNSKVQSLIIKAVYLSRNTKIILAIFLDTILCLLATWLVLNFYFNNLIIFNMEYLIPFIISVCTAIPTFYIFGFYKFIFRYGTSDANQILIKSIIIYALAFSMIILTIDFKVIPKSVGLMQPMILLILIITSRWLLKISFN